MSYVKNNKFNNSKQKDELNNIYSFILNELLKAKKEYKCTTKILAKAFNCSKATISNFETRKTDYDLKMLFNYAGFFRFKIEMLINKMTYSEIMNL